jgi:hypothetical protein
MSSHELSCWEFFFVDDLNKNLTTHAFDMNSSIARANLGNRIQMHKYYLAETYYVINWDNISFASEKVCYGNSSCPVYLHRMERIKAEEERLREMSERNAAKLLIQYEAKKKKE